MKPTNYKENINASKFEMLIALIVLTLASFAAGVFVATAYLAGWVINQ